MVIQRIDQYIISILNLIKTSSHLILLSLPTHKILLTTDPNVCVKKLLYLTPKTYKFIQTLCETNPSPNSVTFTIQKKL